MGLLEQVIGGALASRGGAGGGSSPLVMALMALLASRNGASAGGLGGLLGGALGNGAGASTSGLGGLLESLAQSGHGDVAQSWIGHGANQPIQPHELGHALGQETVGDLSRRSGMASGDLLAQLAQHLPGIVDQLTPQGRLPEAHEAARW